MGSFAAFGRLEVTATLRFGIRRVGVGARKKTLLNPLIGETSSGTDRRSRWSACRGGRPTPFAAGRAVGCQPNASGKRRREGRRVGRIRGETTGARGVATRAKPISVLPRPWASFRNRLRSAERTTWRAMSGNGAVTRSNLRKATILRQAAFCVAARGSTVRASAVPQRRSSRPPLLRQRFSCGENLDFGSLAALLLFFFTLYPFRRAAARDFFTHWESLA